MARDLTFKLILDSLGFQRGAKQAGDALSKLGKDVKQVSGDMKPLADGMDWFGGLAAKLTSPVGMATVAVGAFGAGALAAAKGVAALSQEAEKLQLAATRTGIGLQALQQYQRTAQNMGMSLEQVTGAINKMQRAMEGNTKALSAAGLELGKIKNIAPEEQFQEIAAQIAAMESPSQRTAAAMAAFGRSGAELLPLLMQVGTEGTDAIVTMSNEQIAALGRVDDALDDATGAWTDFKNQVFATIAEMGGGQGLKILADGFRGIAQYIKEVQFAGDSLWESSFIKDILTGNLLKNVINAGARSGMYQGRAGGASPWNLSGPSASASASAWSGQRSSMAGIDFGTMDPMAALAMMERDQAGLSAKITKELSAQEQKQKRINELLDEFYERERQAYRNVRNGIAPQLTSVLTGSRHFGNDTMVGAKNYDFGIDGKGFVTWGDVVEEAGEKAEKAAIDWSGVLGDLTHQLYNLSQVTGGALGGIDAFVAGVANAYAIGGTMKDLWGKGAAGKGAAVAQGAVLLGSIYSSAQSGRGAKNKEELKNEFWSKGSSGAAQGASAGFQVGGPIGAVVGMIFGGASAAQGVRKKYKEIREAGKYVGIHLASSMYDQFKETAEAEGTSVAEVAKDWLETTRKELRTQGMQQAYSGVQGLMGVLGTSPEITSIAAKNFATLFFETVKDEGWVAAVGAFGDIFAKLREHFGDQMPDSLKSIEQMMNLAENPAVAPFLQAAQAQAQFVGGAMNAGFVSTGMQADSAIIARQTLDNLKANGATDAQGYQAIAGLLQSNVNAAVASGQGISAELQALLDEAKANGIDIVADINVQQLDVLRAIYKQLGGTSPTAGTGAGATTDYERPDSGLPAYASGGVGNFGSGRLAMLHGREAIVPLDSNWRPRGGGGGSVQITQQPVFNLNPLQSRADQRRLVEVIIAEWQRANRNDPYSRRVARTTANGGR